MPKYALQCAKLTHSVKYLHELSENNVAYTRYPVVARE